MGLTQIEVPLSRAVGLDAPRPRSEIKVALVSMPFYSVFRPSLQIGLLKSVAERAGFPSSTFHLSIDFASRIGLAAYEALCEERGTDWGDWLFSLAAFGQEAPDPDGKLMEVAESDLTFLKGRLDKTLDETIVDNKQEQTLDNVRTALRNIRFNAVPAYVNEQLEAVAWQDYTVVGFTSTFQQNVSSLALAAAIKRKHPNVLIVFGGANFDGEMGLELIRANEFIDYAFIGEADESFPEFLVALSEEKNPCEVPGVVGRSPSGLSPLRSRPLYDRLDTLPVPDYYEYFERAKRFDVMISSPVPGAMIPFESARGCWWGQKHHCTFCGLNANGMAFRSKSPERVIEELSELARRHKSFQFSAVDNIVDHSYHKTLFKAITDSRYDFNLFYEVKANLSREQLHAMRRAGVTRIQPGIESLSNHVLQLMDKGITGIQNVNLLRWCRYYGIGAGWNLLWGFPHETEQDYAEQLALLKHLVHLIPPNGSRIWMERFSPIFFDRRRFPTVFVRPQKSYAFVYPKTTDLDKIAYFFDYELENALPDSVYEPTHTFLQFWKKLWRADPTNTPALLFFRAEGLLVIEDRRDPKNPKTHSFDSPRAEIYANCSDRPTAVRNVAPLVGTSEEEAGVIMEEFCDAGFMMKSGGLYLSLALPLTKAR